VGGRSLPCDRKLRRSDRLTEKYEYKSVIKNGSLIRAKTFKAYFLSGKELERKAGFIAGKGVGGALERNRARRVLKEAYRGLKPRLRARGFNIVFVAGRATGEADTSEIAGEMEGVLNRCGVIGKQ
jgi:ribonuclease P protein component